MRTFSISKFTFFFSDISKIFNVFNLWWSNIYFEANRLRLYLDRFFFFIFYFFLFLVFYSYFLLRISSFSFPKNLTFTNSRNFFIIIRITIVIHKNIEKYYCQNKRNIYQPKIWSDKYAAKIINMPIICFLYS